MRRSSKVSRGEDGFFLTDVIVGLFILASVSGGLLAAFHLARENAEVSSRTMQALEIASGCLDDEAGVIADKRVRVDGMDFERARVIENLEAGPADVVQLVRISCIAQWTQRGRIREVALARIEARAKGS